MTINQLIELLKQFPLAKLHEVIDEMKIKHPEFAPALNELQSILEMIPHTLNALPTQILLEFYELVRTGRSEPPGDRLALE